MPAHSKKEIINHDPQDAAVPVDPPQVQHAEAEAPKRVTLRDIIKSKKFRLFVGLPIVIVGSVAALLAIPATRYGLLGAILKKDVALQITDSQTGKPVSDAQLTLGGQTGKTDAAGKAVLHGVAVGDQTLTAVKKYYQTLNQHVLVPITRDPSPGPLKLVATGRQVPVQVVSKLTNAAVKGAVITALGASATTDDKGQATIVLPADKATGAAAITADGFNSASAEIVVTAQADPKNTFSITPAGKVYFLSKRTGTINVMKSDLDGGNQQVVISGTGKEDDFGTSLLASRDWRYLELKAKRDSDQPKLYLIDTTNGDKLSVIDEGKNAVFSPIGWYNEYFMYRLDRGDVQSWQPKQQAIKVYNAKTGQLKTIDETDATGNSLQWMHETISDTFILENRLIYTKDWGAVGYNDSAYAGRQMQVMAVDPTGDNRVSLKTFPDGSGHSINAKLYKPQHIAMQVFTDKTYYFEYEDGKVAESQDITTESFNKDYPTYLISPSGKQSLWSEPRDGKNALFVGDSNASAPKDAANLSEYTPYGWFTDDYLLVSKSQSELYILPANNPGKLAPLKITDYHKPSYSFTSYGYGYGGL